MKYEAVWDRGDVQWWVISREGTRVVIHKAFHGNHESSRDAAKEMADELNRRCR